VLKEGPGEDFANREAIAKLLRFSSTHNDSDEQSVALAGYVARMKADQEAIYYVTAESFAAAKNSPHLEIFRKKGIEVLLLADRVDEWLVSSLTEFDGKPLRSVTQGDLELGKLEDEQEKEQKKKADKDFKDLLAQAKKVLGERVKDVRITHRLTTSPACLVTDSHDMSANLERILKAAGQHVPGTKPILELNPDHALIRRLKDEPDQAHFNDWVELLFDQSLLSEGGQLDDPASFVRRMNELLMPMIR
jgi:molecular chaperone HtpG